MKERFVPYVKLKSDTSDILYKGSLTKQWFTTKQQAIKAAKKNWSFNLKKIYIRKILIDEELEEIEGGY